MDITIELKVLVTLLPSPSKPGVDESIFENKK